MTKTAKEEKIVGGFNKYLDQKYEKIYKEKGLAEGRAEGKAEGEETGRIEEGKTILLKLLNKKLKKLPKKLTSALDKLNDIFVIEHIVENIFDIESADDVLEIIRNSTTNK